MVQSKSKLPLSEPTLLIMAALWAEPLHGYGIRQTVRKLSRGRVVLGNGTLYESMRRLQEHGWIVEVTRVADSGRVCRPFELTERGRELLRDELARIVDLCDLCRGLGIMSTDPGGAPRGHRS